MNGIPYASRLRVYAMFTRRSLGAGRALPVLRSPARRDVGGGAMRDVKVLMPAIASIEDLKSAQRRFRSMFLAVNPDDLPACSKPWRRQALHDLRLRMTLCSMRSSLCEVVNPLRLTIYDKEFTLCALRYALCVVLVCER